MELTGFQIQMYKCVIDSGWIEVDPLTVLVGKNESGKTSVLRALHKLNPFSPDPYSIPAEWPRAHRDTRTEDQVVCMAEFGLSDHEIDELRQIAAQGVAPKRVKVTRDYGGRIEVLFPDDLFPDKLHPNDIDKICADLPSLAQPTKDEFAQVANECREEALRLAKEGRFSELTSCPQSHQQRLEAVRSPGNQNPQHQNEQTFIAQHLAALKKMQTQVNETPSIQKKAHDFVVSHLPTFVYMDEYRSFEGSALLDQVKQRREQNKSTSADKTLMTILSLAALDLDELVKSGQSPGRDERQLDLADGAATLSDKIASHWKSLRYQVHFTADGQEFTSWVRDPKDKGLIKLEERSRGFRWFLSFDLMLMHETKGTLKHCVILLDEPGLHLHPTAQRDLLNRLAEYASGNTLIYTTHLPFMIDLQEPQRIRVGLNR